MTDAPKPGEVLAGKFRVERVLGEGGMGVVVAATHLALDQLVAVKLMLPHALANPESVARFEREARAAVRLKSEHVARVSDVGQLESGAPYMVMEFLDGDDLDRVLDRDGALPIETAVDYVLQACEAVAEAHALGIVHRDLKPRNLFLTRRVTGKPLVKVLDFGISKLAGSADDMSLTRTSQVLGSPSYMSPEQLRSARDVDARSDIWALGAILYELSTGRVPFVAETVTQLTAMVVADPAPPVLEHRPDMPPELARTIMKCLEKRREDRFQSVTELADALAPFASVEGARKAGDVLAATGSRRAAPASKSAATVAADAPAAPETSRSNASVRIAGSGASTDVSWDQTQLAPGAVRKGARRAPLLAGAAAAVGIGAVLLFVLSRGATDAMLEVDGGATAPAGSGPAQASSAAPSASPAAELPTVREPVDPPLVSPTGGPDRPPPAGFPSSTPARPTPPASKPDAGAAPKKPGAGPATPSTGTKPDDLPNVRH